MSLTALRCTRCVYVHTAATTVRTKREQEDKDVWRLSFMHCSASQNYWLLRWIFQNKSKKKKKKQQQGFYDKNMFQTKHLQKYIYTETPSASQHRESFQCLVWLNFLAYLFANHSSSCLSPTRTSYEHESLHILVNFCNAKIQNGKRKEHLSTLQPAFLRGKRSWPCANHLEAAC